MVLSEQADRYGLLTAAQSRRRHLPMRFIACGLIAAGVQMTFGWWQVWIWLAVYIGAQMLELAMNGSLLKQPPQTPVLAVLIAIPLYIPSGLVFCLLGPVLWVDGGRYGPALGFALMASALTNLIAMSRGSRLAFTVSSVPYLAFLFVMPLLDWGRVSGTEIGVTVFAVAVIAFNIFGAWMTTEEARKAELEARLEAENRTREAEAAVEAKSAFVAMICHELRTPISAILAGASELERNASCASGRGQAELIGHAGQMMRTLLNDMLDFSRLEAGRMSIETLPLDLRRTIAEVIRMWQPQAKTKGLKLRLEGAVHLPRWVEGDPTRLRQVLNNLLSNAIKFTETGSVTLRLAAAREDGVTTVSMAVEDTGPGMTPQQIERLFTPFDQLDAGVARKYGGSGLGLVISRELSRLMGGEITASSAAGKGASFVLTMPFEEVEAPAMEQAPTVVEARVLVVDDHAVNRQAIALVLAPLGIVPETAASAEEGLERLAREPFDIVLMDVYMPGIDGREATRRLRASAGPNRDTPVIAITASATPKDWDACHTAGMNGYVAKPIEPSQLYAVLEAVASGQSNFEAAA